MKNTLVMMTEASCSLNFLVYIQNIFLNQSHDRNELKFPCMPTKYEFPKDFNKHFRELWEEVSNQISEKPINDLKIFTEGKSLFYHGLFTEHDDTLKDFNDIYQSFNVWWDSFAGRFLVERSIDDYSHEFYVDLASHLRKKGLKPRKQLHIALIYDECLLVDSEPSSYFAILSVKDCLVNKKEVIRKLRLSVD